MRVEFDPTDFDIDLNDFSKHFSPIATKFAMNWRLAQSSHRQKMVIFGLQVRSLPGGLALPA